MCGFAGGCGEEAPPVVFDKPGVVKVGCNIHDWMMGVILVVPGPVFATTDDGGAFVLRDVPAGDVTVAAWHEAGAAMPILLLPPNQTPAQIDFALEALC